MKALSILQPWAWLIAAGHKQVENRRWRSHYRGPLLVHAGKRWGREQREDLAWVRASFPGIELPDQFDLGGIVGQGEMTDCVMVMNSPWFFGPFGFVLCNTNLVPFHPCKGALGFFHVPSDYQCFQTLAVESPSI